MRTRPGKAGKNLGESIIEVVHLMYQNNTAKKFLKSLIEILQEELDERKKQKKKK